MLPENSARKFHPARDFSNNSLCGLRVRVRLRVEVRVCVRVRVSVQP